MYSEEQWEYVGKCRECGANLYRKDGQLVGDRSMPDGHCCSIEEDVNGTGKVSKGSGNGK